MKNILGTLIGVITTASFLTLTANTPSLAAVISNPNAVPVDFVTADFTGIPLPLPLPIGAYRNFQVSLSSSFGGDTLDPKLRLTDFTVQLFDKVTGLDRATFDWSPRAGWKVTERNVAGEAYYEALSSTQGIAPGNSFGDFSVITGGIDTLVTGGLRIENVSFSVIPEPFTILGVTTAVGFGAFFKRKLGKKS